MPRFSRVFAGSSTPLFARASAIALLTLCAPRVAAQDAPIPRVYEPFAFLIGEWDVSVQGGAPAAVSRMAWGPMKTHIRYSGALIVNGNEIPNWDGILVWNGVSQRVDMLLVLFLDSGHLAQEQGWIHTQSDGSVVREITVNYAAGAPVPPDWTRTAGPEGFTARFRHTFTPISATEIRASVFRQSDNGWVPSFPGGDKLIMVRRPSR